MNLYSVSRHRGEETRYHRFAGNMWKSKLRTDCLTEDKQEAELTFEGVIKEKENDGYEIRLNTYKMEFDEISRIS